MSTYNTTTILANQIALVEVAPPFGRLIFQFMPQNIPWSRSGNWVRVPIVGRNNSRKQLTGGEDRINLSLDFNATFEEDKELCVKQFAFLNSLTIIDPQKEPSRLKLIWGNSNLFRFKIWVVTAINGDLGQFHSGFDFNPMQANINVELEMDPDENMRLDDVRMQEPITFRNSFDFVPNPSGPNFA